MQHVSRRSRSKKNDSPLAEQILALLYFLGLWYNIQKTIAGGMSSVFKHIVRLFFNTNAGAHNFKNGIIVDSPARSHDSWLLQAEFGAFVGDEKACKEVSDTKGASGTSFCLFCKNVVRNVGGLDTTDYCQIDCFLYLRNFKLQSGVLGRHAGVWISHLVTEARATSVRSGTSKSRCNPFVLHIIEKCVSSSCH